MDKRVDQLIRIEALLEAAAGRAKDLRVEIAQENWDRRNKAALTEFALRQYQQLHDGLSDMVESGHLEELESQRPAAYRWLVEKLELLARLESGRRDENA